MGIQNISTSQPFNNKKQVLFHNTFPALRFALCAMLKQKQVKTGVQNIPTFQHSNFTTI